MISKWDSASKAIYSLAVCVMLLADAVQIEAQQTMSLPRIGYLAGDSGTRTIEAFRQGLRDFGYIEKKNVLIEWRFAEKSSSRYRTLAEELIGLKPRVIVAGNGPAVTALKQATSKIPIIIAYYGGDPVADGLVSSFAKPGGNITGAIPLTSELSGKRLEIVKEALPSVSRLAIMWNPDASSTRSQWEETTSAARRLGLDTISVEVRSPDDIATAIQAAKRQEANALVVLTDPVTYISRQQIVGFAKKLQFPGMYPLDDFTEAGGLMSYSPNNEAQYRRAAYYVDKILKGANPGDLPIEQPTKFELVINLKTAKQIGVTIPPNVLARADRVIR